MMETLQVDLVDSKLVTSFPVEGYTSPGFEHVKEIFSEIKKRGADLGSQVSAYHNGKLVVELWGGPKSLEGLQGYSRDTLQVVFSSGKMLSSLVVAILVDQGKLSYDEPVAKYWPEFGAHGKDIITVSELLCMEAGIPNPEGPLPLSEETLTDLDALGKLIESATPTYYKNTKRCYHAVTRGWAIANLVPKVDGKKRAFKQFVQEEIAEPLGIEFYFGLPEKLDNRVASMEDPKLETFLPKLTGVLEKNEKLRNTFAVIQDPSTVSYKAGLVFPGTICAKTANTRLYRKAVNPDAGGISNARSMAKIAAMLANGGEIDGIRIVSQRTLEISLQPGKKLLDSLFEQTSTWTKGGWAILDEGLICVEGERWFGWGGLGGSLFAFNTKLNLSFAFCMNLMSFSNPFDMRYYILSSATQECVRKLNTYVN